MKKLFLAVVAIVCGLVAVAQTSPLKSDVKPLIAVSCSHPGHNSSTRMTYTNSVIKAGGIPVLVPITTDSIVLRDILKRVDGLLLIGGEDIHPSYYGEKPIPELGSVDSIRDIYDIALIRMAGDMNMPMMGVCRGEQLINVAFGGTLYQDIPAQHHDLSVSHRQKVSGYEPTHRVRFVEGSTLAGVIGQSELMTNTFHHQAVKKVAPGFRVSAWADDSIPEAIESAEGRPIWGVQFHPEYQTENGDEVSARFFYNFLNEADKYRRAKAIHRNNLTVDTHTDTPLFFKDGYNIGNREKSQVCIPKMEEGMLDAQYLACWVKQGVCDEAHTEKAVQKVNSMIEGIYAQVAMNSDKVEVARTPEDLIRIKAEGKKAFLIGIENAYGVGNSLSDIKRVQDLGVTYITLCHTGNNDYCDSSSEKVARWNGLSPLGKKAVAEMNRLGMIIDVSHASQKTFWDVIKYSKKPIIASHSSSREMYDHNRNLTDDQLRALAKNGGVVQVCMVKSFLKKNRKTSSLDDVIDHLCHMIEVAGIDHVGIGSDFDGGGGVIGCDGDNDFIRITVKLLERGYSEKDIAKIWGGNFLRVMAAVQSK